MKNTVEKLKRFAISCSVGLVKKLKSFLKSHLLSEHSSDLSWRRENLAANDGEYQKERNDFEHHFVNYAIWKTGEKGSQMEAKQNPANNKGPGKGKKGRMAYTRHKSLQVRRKAKALQTVTYGRTDGRTDRRTDG